MEGSGEFEILKQNLDVLRRRLEQYERAKQAQLQQQGGSCAQPQHQESPAQKWTQLDSMGLTQDPPQLVPSSETATEVRKSVDSSTPATLSEIDGEIGEMDAPVPPQSASDDSIEMSPSRLVFSSEGSQNTPSDT